MKYIAEFKSNYESADKEVIKVVDSIKKEHEINKEYYFILDFVLRELINNAIEHGNRMDTDKTVKLLIDISDHKIHIEVFDHGEGFDLEEVMRHIKDKDISRTRGRGLLSIIKLGFDLKASRGLVRCTSDFNQNNLNK